MAHGDSDRPLTSRAMRSRRGIKARLGVGISAVRRARRRSLGRRARVTALVLAAVAIAAGMRLVQAQVAQLPATPQQAEPPQATVPPTPTAPASFLGLANGRVGLFATTEGKLLRWVTEASFIHVPVLSAARGTVYFTVDADGRDWRQVDVATGTERALTPRLRNVQQLAPSPDGRYLAYAQTRPAEPDGPATLAVRDVRSGTERRYPAGGRVVDLHWSPDDRQLGVGVVGNTDGVFQLPKVVDLASGRIAFLAPPPGPGVVCTVLGPRFSATEIITARSCRSWTELLRYERITGRFIGRLQLSKGRDPGHIEDLSVDPASGQILYVLVTGTSDATVKIRVMTIRHGQPVAIPTPKGSLFQVVDW